MYISTGFQFYRGSGKEQVHSISVTAMSAR